MKHIGFTVGTLVLVMMICISCVLGCELTFPQLNQTLSGPTDSAFGWPVTMDATRLVVGATNDDDDKGSVFVFDLDGDTWSLSTTLRPSDVQIDDQFGYSVGMFEDVLAVGSPFHNESGAVWIYRFINTTAEWELEQKLNAPNNATGLWFGWAVTVSRDMIFVAAPGDSVGESLLAYAGSVYVYRFNTPLSIWQQTQRVVATDPTAFSWFSQSGIVTSGEILVIGCPSCNVQRGAAYAYSMSAGVVGSGVKLRASDGTAMDSFASSLAFSGDTLIVASFADDVNRGSVYVFRFSDGVWSELEKIVASDRASSDYFGGAVAVHGHLLIVGAAWKSNSSGKVYLFEKSNETNTWRETGQLTAPTLQDHLHFGESLAMTQDQLAVSAYGAEKVFVYQFGSAFEQVTAGIVRDGSGLNERVRFQSVTNRVGANWDAFVIEKSREAPQKVTSYNLTTVELGTGRFVVGPKIIEFSEEQSIFSFQSSLSEPDLLLHNHTYVTTVQVFPCACCDVSGIQSSGGFLVDTTPPTEATIESPPAIWPTIENLNISWTGFEDFESGIEKIHVQFLDLETGVVLFNSSDLIPSQVPFGTLLLTWSLDDTPLTNGSNVEIQIQAHNGAGLATNASSTFRVVVLIPPSQQSSLSDSSSVIDSAPSLPISSGSNMENSSFLSSSSPFINAAPSSAVPSCLVMLSVFVLAFIVGIVCKQ